MTARRVFSLLVFLMAGSLAAWGATITITPNPLPNGTISGAYSETLVGTGGTAPYTWAVTAGALPPGLTLHPSTGVIDGTFTQAGTFTFTIGATDSATPTPNTGSQQFTINVIGITTATPMPGGYVGVSYSQTLTATGGVGTLTWYSDNPPPGLTVNSNGTITGTPTTVGTYPFSVTVTDSTENSATGSLTISIAQPAITPSSLSNGTVGIVYSQQFATSPAISGLAWTVSSGSLPPGLTLSGTGLLSGTPTTAGPFSFTIAAGGTVSEATVNASQAYMVAVAEPAITPSSLAGGNIGASYSQQFATSPAISGLTWSYTGNLPTGLTFSSGLLSGTLTAQGTFNFTVTATAAPVSTSQAYTFITGGNASPSITTTAFSTYVGASFSGQLLGSGGAVLPYSYTLNSTSGAANVFNVAANGVVTGTPTVAGTTTLSVTITDASVTQNHSTSNVVITVSGNGGLSITTTSPLTPGVINVPYTNTLAATGGTTPYTWAVTSGTLPAGLALAPSTGILSGTPTAAGTTTFNVTVTDSANPAHTATASLTIVISTSTLTITTTSPLTSGAVGTAYSTTLQASGGTSPYTWAVTSGSLPAGLTLASSTGILSGTPTAAGTTTFNVTVTDSATNPTHTATTSMTIVIGSSSLHITTTSPLPVGTLAPYSPVTFAATGGTAPYMWAVTSGSLPAGLTLVSSTGILSGTPTATGTTTFSVTVTDSTTPTALTATASFSITISATTVQITTTSPIHAGPLNVPYSTVVQATGGTPPYNWSATGLPAGLSIAAGTGAISGTPTSTGTTTFIVTVSDSSSPALTATTSLSILVTTPTLTVTGVNSTCFVAYVGRPFPDQEITPPVSCPTNNTYQFTATGSAAVPASYSFAPANASALPPGMTLFGNGVLSGTPTAAGTYTFWVVATDSLQAQGALQATVVVGTFTPVSSSSITLGGSTGPSIGAGLQPAVVLSIGNTYPFPINGTVNVSFASTVGGLNTLVTFANGLSATFRIPAGGQAASVGAITTGTQAGTITLTATQFTDDYGNIVPSSPAMVSYTVEAGVPVITGVTVSNSTTSGFTLAVTGYSTTRDMTSGQFNFTAATGDALAASSVTVPLTAPFTTWYSDSRSYPFGSAFVLTIPFTFTSTTTTTTKPVSGVTVTLTNSKGTSTPSASVTP